MLQVSVLSLVLKVIFQDYVLEHLPITEQLELFDDASPEFLLAQSLYLQKNENNNSDFKSLPSFNSAQTSQSSKILLKHCEIDILTDPDLYYVKNLFEERIKHALQYNLAYDSPLLYVH